jgi:FlaA1/EpsC-like NDP-sugar epimerase
MILDLKIMLFTRLFNFIVHKLQKMKVIITGSTGMVGEGVLHECLNHNKVDQILLVNRKPCGIQHPKIKEIIHADPVWRKSSRLVPRILSVCNCL